VPTGIVTAEMAAERFGPPTDAGGSAGQPCGRCGTGGHRPTAKFCQDCGAPL
jgi:voltage-gated potassium channel